jgi:hypothetical protein
MDTPVVVADCIRGLERVAVLLPLPQPLPPEGSAVALERVRVIVHPPGHEAMVRVVAAVTVTVEEPTPKVVGSGQ